MVTIKLNPKINFFATADELACWVETWVRRYGLYYALTRNKPSFGVLQEVPWDDEKTSAQYLRDYTGILLQLEPIQTDVPTINHLRASNPAMLTINLPDVTSKGLRYGMFGTGTKDREALKIWNEIGKDFFDKTAGGLWQLFPLPPYKSFSPEMRYSLGAAELWWSNYPLVGPGNDTWHVEEPIVRPAQ